MDIQTNCAQLFDAMKESPAVVLTGAGVSTLSGIPDFRSGRYPIWQRYSPEEVFEIERFRRDPAYFYRFSRELFPHGANSFLPNEVHRAIASLEKQGLVSAVITQNIDGLHQKAGSRCVLEVHGSWERFLCEKCDRRFSLAEIEDIGRGCAYPKCPHCSSVIRPDVVFYGEQLPEAVLAEAMRRAAQATLMIVLGSSLVVYPAASIPAYTLHHGGRIVIFNKQATQYDEHAWMRFEDLQDFVAMCTKKGI